MALQQPRDLPRATGDLQRHPVGRLQAPANASSASGVTLTRPAERTTPSSQIAISQKSRCRSRPIARPTHLNNCDTSHLPSYDNAENQRANDTDRYVLSAQSGQVAGAAKKNSPRSKRIVQNGLPACVLPRRPPSRITRPYVQGRTEPSEPIFMPRTAAAPDRRLLATASSAIASVSASL